jgi:hypothetical protein
MSSLIQGYQLSIPFELSSSKSSGSLLFTESGSLELNTTANVDFLTLKQDGTSVFKVNNEKVVEYKELINTPTVVTGGMFYSASNWYLYYEQY